jgi:hypothetical protein
VRARAKREEDFAQRREVGPRRRKGRRGREIILRREGREEVRAKARSESAKNAKEEGEWERKGREIGPSSRQNK